MRTIGDVLRCRHCTGLRLDAIARALIFSKGVVPNAFDQARLAGRVEDVLKKKNADEPIRRTPIAQRG